MDIVIIGSGNVATALGKKAQGAGHRIVQVASRNVGHAKQLADVLGCSFASLQDVDRSAFLYILAVSDSALPELAAWLRLSKAMVLHTAGSVSKDVLRPISSNYGVLWPLQSLRKETELPDFPLVIDGSSAECMTLITDLAEQLSSKVCVMDDEKRRSMHLAAVISGNFSNHLFSMVYHFCEKEGLDFSLLLPMLKETVARLDGADPATLQTGPAIRGDVETMNRHMEMLWKHEDLRELYDMFSSLIIKNNSY